MSRSIIQTVNQSLQAVTAGSTIALGSVLRRFGCNCRLNGSSVIEISDNGGGYYEVIHDKYKKKIEKIKIKL